METIPCPGCTTALEPSATVCPICLRPRGKLEITRAYATMREMERQRRRRPFIIAGYLLAAGAAGGLVYLFHAPIIAGAVYVRAHVGSFINEQLASAVPAAPAPAVAPAQSAAPTSPSAFPGAPSPAPALSPTPAPAGAVTTEAHAPQANIAQRPAHVEDLPLPSFDSGSQWAIYGRVYDLITLLPVANARLNFNMVSSRSGGAAMTYGGAVSDADGRFSVALTRLPDGSSFEIRASLPGYASPALYESDIPYATLPLAERREIVHNAQDGDMTLPPLTDIAGEGSRRRDVFLAPSR